MNSRNALEANALNASPLLHQRIVMIVILALLYFLAGRLGLLLAIPPGYATAIFPAAGIALAALLLYGNRVWPGILLGSFALNLTMAPHFDSLFSIAGLIALMIAIGATLQGWLGATLIRRYAGFPSTLSDEREIFRFYMLGGPISCLVNSLIGTTTLFLVGAISLEVYGYSWLTWWIGDMIGVFIATPLAFIVLAQPRYLWRRRAAAVALPLLVTLLVVITIFFYASKWETQEQRDQFNHHAKAVVTSLESTLLGYSAILDSIGQYFVAAGDVDRAQFGVFVSKELARQHNLQALEWLPVVKGADRARFERTQQAGKFPGFRIHDRNSDGRQVAAAIASEYVPVTFIEPYQGNENALGYNVASNPSRLEALLHARNSGESVATGRIKLVQGTGEQSGILIFSPVYGRTEGLATAADRAEHIRGYAAAVLRIGDLMDEFAQKLSQANIALRVTEPAALEEQRLLYQSLNWPGAMANSGIGKSAQVSISGRIWRLEFWPLPKYIMEHRAWQAWATLAGGLLFAGMLGALLLLITGRTGKVQAVVDERTNELRVIMDNVIDAIISISEHGIVKSFNRAAEGIFAYPAGEVIGQNIKMLMQEAYYSEYDGYLERYRYKHATYNIGTSRELVGQRKDGSTFPMELTISQGSHSEHALFIGVIRDITERKRIDRMKSEFVSTVSHELRTPLTSISGALGLLAGNALGEMPAQAKQMVDMAYQNSLRLTTLINDLLDMDKLIAGKTSFDLQNQPLMSLVDQALESIHGYGEQYQVSFKLVSRENVEVRIDSGRVVQVLNNFLSNAAKFSPRGGQVEIAVQRLNDTVRVTVTDHGNGIPAEFKDRIFQKFSQADSSDTRKRGGTGLGLAISKELIEHMNGVIGFESVEGQGASFYFELPLV